MINLKNSQNPIVPIIWLRMIGIFEKFENWPTSDPYCAKTGPNTYPDFYML